MNSENLLKKWGCAILWLGLAGVSCYWTEQSLALFMEDFRPEILIWILTIAFFIIASYGTKLIVDALNQDVYIEHRRRTFWIGVVLTFVFWLLISMPTNTHTIFYKSHITSTVQEDISTTSKYLTQIKNREVTDSAYYKWHDEIYSKFKIVLDEFEGRKSGNSGSGKLVRSYLMDINQLLESQMPGSSIKFNDQAMNSTNPQIFTNYENQFINALEKIRIAKYQAPQEAIDKAENCLEILSNINDSILYLSQSGKISDSIIAQAAANVKIGYGVISKNHKYVNFNHDNNGLNDKDQYVPKKEGEHTQTKIERQKSAYNTWVDFLQGKYPLSFLYAIFVALLVDIAAFMFFDFAFKKQ